MNAPTATAAAILVVEDDPGMGRFLHESLSEAGHRVVVVDDGRSALAELGHRHLDLVILDLGLPDIDGMDLMRTLREWDASPLILVVSARGQDGDKVAALRAGADDYLAKPFSLQELLARVEARLRRRPAPGTEEVLESAGLRLELAASQVLRHGVPVRLTPMELGVLRELLRHHGRVRTHREILAAVWGPAFTAEHTYVRTIVQRLRGKLEDDPGRPLLITTVPGVGYVWQDSAPTVQPPR